MGGRGKGTFSGEEGPGLRERVVDSHQGNVTPPHRSVKCVRGLTWSCSSGNRARGGRLWSGGWVGRLAQICSDMLAERKS